MRYYNVILEQNLIFIKQNISLFYDILSIIENVSKLKDSIKIDKR